MSRVLIDTPGGGHVALGKVASLSVNTTPSDITRYNGSNNIDVLANIGGANLGSVTATVNQSAQVVNTYRNKPYGVQLAKTGAGADPRAENSVHLPPE